MKYDSDIWRRLIHTDVTKILAKSSKLTSNDSLIALNSIPKVYNRIIIKKLAGILF